MFDNLIKGLKRVLKTSRVRRLLYYYDKLWVRIAVIGALSVVAIVLAYLTEQFLPDSLNGLVDPESTIFLLEIIANSMLAATIFSLTVMVSVHRAAESAWTPRVHRLLVTDNTTRNIIAALMGAYIFSIVSIVLIETRVFPEDQVLIIFGFTLLVLVLIIVAIVRWAVHLQFFGSLADTADQIEAKTRLVMETRASKPFRGGHEMKSSDDVPQDSIPVRAEQTGYIHYILEDQLDQAAEKADAEIYILREAGALIFCGDPLVHITREDDDLIAAVRENIRMGRRRSFDEDPAFGFIGLREIASRALSPGINDPGTAIDMLSRMGRLLIDYDPDRDEQDELTNPRLHAPAVTPREFFEDGFVAIMRDGAGMIEVQKMAQRVLARLTEHGDAEIADHARWAAAIGLEYAEAAIDRPDDITDLRALCPATTKE